MKKIIITNKFVSKINKDIKKNSHEKKESLNETSTKFSKQINLINSSQNIQKTPQKINKNNIFRNGNQNSNEQIKSLKQLTNLNNIEISISKIKQSIIEHNKNKLNNISKHLTPKEDNKKIRLRNNSENYNKKYETQLFNRYNKYNISDILYQIDKTYSKINFNDKDFITRMNNYATKRNLRDDKINEILNDNKPKISKENLLKIFNRLIEDSNRRNEANLKIEILKKSNIILNDYSNKLIKNKSINPERWKKIYEDRFKCKFEKYNNNRKNKKLELELKKKKNEENEITEMKKYSKSIVLSKDYLNEFNKRLYYEPISKKKLSSFKNFKLKNQEFEYSIKLSSKKNHKHNNKEKLKINRNKSLNSKNSSNSSSIINNSLI
jgi:hypothetical protein